MNRLIILAAIILVLLSGYMMTHGTIDTVYTGSVVGQSSASHLGGLDQQ